MSMQNPNRVAAAARVTGSTGVFTANRGFTSVVRNGPGNWTLTLDQQLDPLESAPMVQQINALAAQGATFDTRAEADATLQVNARDNLGAQVDVDWAIVLFALSSRG